MLLRPEPFIFEGVAIDVGEHGRRTEAGRRAAPADVGVTPSSSAASSSASSLTFAPRAAAKRPGKSLGKGRPMPKSEHMPPLVSAGATAQDAFRAIVESKNKQREVNLETSRAKRRHDDEVTTEDQDDSKKHKSSSSE